MTTRLSYNTAVIFVLAAFVVMPSPRAQAASSAEAEAPSPGGVGAVSASHGESGQLAGTEAASGLTPLVDARQEATAGTRPAASSEDAESSAPSKPPAGPAGQGDDKRTYTWEELTQLMPELEAMEIQVGTQPVSASGLPARRVPMVCDEVAKLGSRIKRRKCWTIQEYVDRRQRLRELGYAQFDLLVTLK